MRDNAKLFLKDFKDDTRGNFAMMVGVCSMAILMSVGAAIDYSGMAKARQNLQSQVDSGVLAAARLEGKNGKDANLGDRKKTAETVMQSNGYDLQFHKPKVSEKDGVITVEGKADYKTVFMGILGKSSMPVTAIAKSQTSGDENMEIVLVLDNTSSMSHDGKLDALKSGANGLLSAMESNANVKIGIVPFSRYVNIGTAHKDETWLDIPNEPPFTESYNSTQYTGGTKGTNCRQEPHSYVQDGFTVNTTREVCDGGTAGTPTTTTHTRTLTPEWKGCVGTRNAPRNINDDQINVKIPGINDITRDRSAGAAPDAYWRNYCPQALTRLTDDFVKLKADIASLWTTDNTYMPLGLIWGQRVLSNRQPFDDGSALPKTAKVLILMTDGKNTVEMKWPPHLQDSADKLTSPTADTDTAALCTNIKRDNITIYSIAFKVDDVSTRKILQRCATSTGHYFKADDNKALIDTFNNIAGGLNAVRLTQ